MAVSQSLTVTQSSQSVVNNYSIVRIRWQSTQSGESWNGYTRTAYYYVSKNGGTEEKYSVSYTLPKQSTVTIVDVEIVVPHRADGTGSVKVRTWMDTDIYEGVVEQTKTLTLATIPRKSTLTVGNGTLGAAMNLAVTKQSDSFTHTITYKCGTDSGTICTKASDANVSWTPPLGLAGNAPSANEVPITFTITTYSGNTEIGSASAFSTCTIPNTSTFVPVLLPTITDAMGYVDKYGGFVQGQSKLKVTMTTYGVYGAWIASVKTEFDGATYTTQEVTSNIIVNSGTLPVKITVTDSRGRQSVSTANITVLPYSYPKITAFSANRCNSDGTLNPSGAYLLAKFSATVSGLNSKNKASYYIGYKKVTETNHTAVNQTNLKDNYSVTNATYVIPADTDSSYTVIFTVVDDFRTTRIETTGSSAAKVWSLLKKDGKIVGAALGKVAEHEDTFDIGWKVKFSGGGDCVIEAGEKDGWIYRKWDSGIAECFKILTVTTKIQTAWGTMFVGDTKMARQSYPLVFTSKPVETATLQAGSATGWLFPESSGNGVNGGYASAIYNIARPNSVTTDQVFYIALSATGKWK